MTLSRETALQALRFVLVGGLNTLFGYGVFFLLVRGIGLGSGLALALATVAGILFNFKSFGTLVFNNTDPRCFGRFFAGYGVLYIVNLTALNALTGDWSGNWGWGEVRLGPEVGQAVLTPLVAAASYGLNRFWVFPAPSQSSSFLTTEEACPPP